jgi:hypothetical protein
LYKLIVRTDRFGVHENAQNGDDSYWDKEFFHSDWIVLSNEKIDGNPFGWLPVKPKVPKLSFAKKSVKFAF